MRFDVSNKIKMQEKDITAQLFDRQVNSAKYSAGTPQQWTLYTKDAARMKKKTKK